MRTFNPSEDAWNLVAPGAQEQQLEAENFENVTLTHIEQTDLDANASIILNQTPTFLQRFDLEINRELMSPEEYRKLMRGLNSKQKQIVHFHRQWCKKAVLAMKKEEAIQPYRVFLSGAGGVGKSYVISLIHRDTMKLLSLSGQLQPDDITVLLTAPTGVAAFNIAGMTLHAALLLNIGKCNAVPLSYDKLNSLRTKLSHLQLLIIDEISMVGSTMLYQIHKRLQQLMGTSNETTFGNISILAVGDLYQLRPVGQAHVFAKVNDAYAQLHKSGSLWKDEFTMLELDEIMRQKEDLAFAQLLCRLRCGTFTQKDIQSLQNRTITDDHPEYPNEALHVYAYNKHVDKHNMFKLNNLCPAETQESITAIDEDKDHHTQMLNVTMPHNKAQTGGLVRTLQIAIGAKVMLTNNVDVSDGLVNGARGLVTAIIKHQNTVLSILVTFNNPRIGAKAIAQSHYRRDYPTAVPIQRYEAVFSIGKNKAAQVSRRQYPLVLA